jgi:hypothetical protein
MEIEGWSLGEWSLLCFVGVRNRCCHCGERLTLVHNEAGGIPQVLDFHRDFHRRPMKEI